MRQGLDQLAGQRKYSFFRKRNQLNQMGMAVKDKGLLQPAGGRKSPFLITRRGKAVLWETSMSIQHIGEGGREGGGI